MCDNKVGLTKAKFCSKECHIQHKTETLLTKIKTKGVLYPDTHFHTSSTAKKYITLLNGPLCSVCNILPVWNDKPLNLVLDHINGIPNDWRLENLRLVCPNCDSQLPTFKNKNKGNGRPRYLRHPK